MYYRGKYCKSLQLALAPIQLELLKFNYNYMRCKKWEKAKRLTFVMYCTCSGKYLVLINIFPSFNTVSFLLSLFCSIHSSLIFFLSLKLMFLNFKPVIFFGLIFIMFFEKQNSFNLATLFPVCQKISDIITET